MTSFLRARTATGIAALLVAGMVSGCAKDEPSSGPPPTSTSRAVESSSPSEPAATPTGPVEPTPPAEANRATRAGAKAFVQYYWAVVNYATATGDVALLETLSEPSCSACRAGIRQITKVYDRGGRIVGGLYEVLELDPFHLHDAFWSVRSTTRTETQFVRGAGDLNQQYPGGESGLHFTLRFHHGSWKTSTLEAL